MVEAVALGDRRARAGRRRSPCARPAASSARAPGDARLLDHLVDPLARSRSRARRSTSVRNIAELPRPSGGVRPGRRVRGLGLVPGAPSPRSPREPGAGVRGACRWSSVSHRRAASRIVSSGGSSPVQIRSEAAPWWTRTSSRRRRAHRGRGRPLRAASGPTRRPGPPRLVLHLSASAASGSGFRSSASGAGSPLACARPTVVAFTIRPYRSSDKPSAAPCSLLMRDSELARQRLGPLRGAVPDRHRRARLAQRPDAGAGRAAGAEHERALAGGRRAERRQQPGGVGVLGRDRRRRRS